MWRRLARRVVMGASGLSPPSTADVLLCHHFGLDFCSAANRRQGFSSCQEKELMARSFPQSSGPCLGPTDAGRSGRTWGRVLVLLAVPVRKQSFLAQAMEHVNWTPRVHLQMP